MRISINEQLHDIPAEMTLDQLRRHKYPGADICVLNGAETKANTPLQSGDRVVFICSGHTPSTEEFNAMLKARHGVEVQQTLERSCVAIAGVGGLGSNVAIALARAGIGCLIIADQDVVELSNLQRQQYFLDQIGCPKVTAMATTLKRINPGLHLTTHHTRVDSHNLTELFASAHILVEAFDHASAKAELTQTWLQTFPERPLVAASGVAGFGAANSIITQRPFARLYVCGDGASAVEAVGSLCASRVGVAASHQAHAVVRLLLGLDPLTDTPTTKHNSPIDKTLSNTEKIDIDKKQCGG
ncbi:MAG: sulfur carrier protein ThiS adenylyltransferase ThiF [Desulfuromonadaceae bacterium]|nr:sulfur carrier protein ThiS adenylyltransferase ThiF [Desulfuromonas sp.]MDY0185987.1 sulfur carrier protein ThiS adenylyltransferase ThiF [Desulfuromonadaceae bacterium]